MKTAAIICEYNPLHLGHARQYQLLRQALGEDACIVCLMSGDFVQRGEPAVFDAQVRAASAVMSGASLVLELPLPFAISSAEGFAAGAVDILNRLGGIDALCFGCESGNAQSILETARLLRTPAFSEALRASLSCGDSFAALRQRTVCAMGGDGSVLREPNDILAVEYCKALLATDSSICPLAIRRKGGYHDGTPEPSHPSATALRALLPDAAWLRYIPEAARPILAGAAVHRLAWGERAVLARLRAMEEPEFEALPYGAEGLWRRLMAKSREADSLEALISGVKSSRYARSRIMRMVLCAFLGVSADTLRAPAPYARILAFDALGRRFLKETAAERSIPLLHAGQTPYSDLERRAKRLYSLFLPPDMPAAMERKTRVFSKPEE